MNMIKKVSGIAAGVALAFGLAAPASAAPFSLSAGNIKITFNAFDAGTVGYSTAAPGILCSTVEACDAAAGDPSRGAIGSEDTWGIFSVESISNLSTGMQIFRAGDNGQYLTGVFGGLKDTLVEVSGTAIPTISTLSTGGWLNMYLNNAMYDASIGTSGRIGADGYVGITDIGGELVLKTEFAPSVVSTPEGYSYASSYRVNGATGDGSGFLDVIGGSWAELFDTNSIDDLAGGEAHDLILNTSYDVLGDYENGWNVDASGDVEGRVPEPGSLALLGLGFAGLASLRRRRAAK